MDNINIQEINHRNTITVEQALKNMNAKILEQQIQINGLNASMSTMYERLNSIEMMVKLQKIKEMGCGASV